MESDCSVNAFKAEQQILQADKKIAALETLCEKRRQQEQAYYNEVLIYHKKTAKLEQELLVANRKIAQLQVLSQEAEKLNKTRRNDYLEACKTISSLEAKNLCLVNREAYLEKQVQTLNKNAKQMERENLAAIQKVSELEQTQELIEKKRREAVGQVYKLQTKNAELEATLEVFNRRNRYDKQDVLKKSYSVGTTSSTSGVVVESAEELTECDRQTTDGMVEMQRKVDELNQENKDILEHLHNAESDILEGERMNSELRQQVIELKKMLHERDNQVKQCKQLFEKSRRDSQEEICKLEGAVYHWQSRYDQSLIELEKENNNNTESKREMSVNDGHEACWECELRLRACHSEIAERDITITYLQKINESHEDKIRQILNKYKEGSKHEETFKRDVTARNLSSVSDLHHELQILLAFYKKRSENATIELNKWKALAVEARLCRERENTLFESQLSVISKDYYSKYENCRSLLEKEKIKRIALEGQIRRLVRTSEESEECRNQYSQYRQESPHSNRQRHVPLVNNNKGDKLKHENLVTQLHGQIACQQYFNVSMADSVDERMLPMASSTGEQSVTDAEIALKHENSNCERDFELESVDVMIDAEKETVVENEERPVDSKLLVDVSTNAIVNGSNDSGDREVNVHEQSLKMEVENLQKSNKELQALCEKFEKEREESSQTNDVSGQQSLEMAAKCECYENEIQKLKQEIQEAALRYTVLEKKYIDCKAENQKLEELVRELRARILDSEHAVTEKDPFAMASETKTQSAEVVGPQKDGAKEIEDALNEGFAAQDLQTVPDKLEEKPTDKPAAVRNEKSTKEEHSTGAGGKLPGHLASFPRKFPSTSTAPIPFKLHSHSGSSHTPSRQRTRSVDHTNTDRRESVGSDTSENVAGDTANEGKPRFMQKKLSSSHLDAFKPKPFKKQASLADDVHLYSRPPRKNSGSQAESTGSASDSEPGRETATQQTDATTIDSTDNCPPAEAKSPHEHEKHPKEPPKTLPKPQKTSTEKTSFQSGFSKKEYYSSIRPVSDDKTQVTTPPSAPNLENQGEQNEVKETVDTSEGQANDKGELV